MTKNQWMLIALVVVLGGFSLYLNRNWFGGQEVQIVHRSRPARTGFSGNQKTEPIFFAFDRTLALTSLKVIPVSATDTNKYAHPVWHLVSDSNSVPITDFAYGEPVEGMRPAVQGAAPDPLEPGVKYRLVIEAGKIKAEHDFTPVSGML
jgi:hypothetical protein